MNYFKYTLRKNELVITLTITLNKKKQDKWSCLHPITYGIQLYATKTKTMTNKLMINSNNNNDQKSQYVHTFGKFR